MKIAIVGAGIAGLAASHKLPRLGHDVTIFEASERAGGRGRRLNRPGSDDWADVGSQYYHSNYTHGLQLIDELGLSPKLKTIKGKTRMFSGKGRDSYLMSPSLPWIKPGGLFGNLRVAYYVARLLLSHRSPTFAATHDQDSIAARSAFSSTDNKFVRDHIVRMLSLIGGLSEPDITNVTLLQIHRLIKIILMTDYVSLEGGTATLHEALAEQANIRFNSPVAELLEQNGRVTGLKLESGERIAADHVIVAAHAPNAAQLTPGHWKIEKDFLSGIEMPPAYIISFFLDRSLENDVWTYFLPMDHQGPVTFCVDTQQKSPGNTPSGKATLQAWILNPKSKPLGHLSDEALAELALADVATFLPGIEGMVEGVHVTRHHAAVPQASVGHNARALSFLESVDARDGVSYCGDYLSGGYMESALWSVERAISHLGEASLDQQSILLDAAA